MKLVIASDHAGFDLKEEVRAYLDEGRSRDSRPWRIQGEPQDDYPDFAESVGEAIKAGEAPRGILICGSGVGVSVAANKIPGIRAGMCHDTYSAHQGVEHDDMNVLVLGARIVGVCARLRIGRRISQGEVHLQRRTVHAALQKSAGNRSEVYVRQGSTSPA